MKIIFHVTYKFLYVDLWPRNRLGSVRSITCSMIPNTKCCRNPISGFRDEAFGLMDSTWYYAFILFIYAED